MAKYCYVSDKIPEYRTFPQYQEPSPYPMLVKIELLVLSVLTIISVPMFYPVFSNTKPNNLASATVLDTKLNSSENVLGASDPATKPEQGPLPPAESPTPSILPSPTPSPETTPPPAKPHAKNSYSIAVYGDSMVDTMGEKLEYLEHALKKEYPDVAFTLYNYGQGSQHVETGLSRWDSRFDYMDRHYPPITEVKPDIIIIGSFAYNPFSPHDRDRHWLGLTRLVEKAKSTGSRVYLMAEIAPLRKNFGKGPNGVNWDENTSYEHSGKILQLLENAVGLASTLQVGLINVFAQSNGLAAYVNPSDGIHPSVQGHEFTAKIITDTIRL